MARGRKLELGAPYGAKVLALKPADRERIRRAILVSTEESDSEIAARLTPPVAPDMVSAMRERLEGLGVIAKGSAQPGRKPRAKKPSDNLDLFEVAS